MGSWAPASLVLRTPLFSSFRIPSRYTIPFLLLATSTLAWSLARSGATALARRAARVLVTLLCVLASAHAIVVNRANLRHVFNVAPFDTSFRWMRSPSQLTTDVETRRKPMLRALARDQLFLDCYEPLQLRRTVMPGLPPVYSDGGSTVSVSRFQPNRIEFRAVNGNEPSRVYLNTNWSRGWQSDAGALTQDDDDPPYVTLSPGRAGTFAFWFVPEGLWMGSVIAGAAALVSLSIWRVRI